MFTLGRVGKLTTPIEMSIPHTDLYDFRVLRIMELRWKVDSNYDLPERSIPLSFDNDIISINSSFIFSAQCKK